MVKGIDRMTLAMKRQTFSKFSLPTKEQVISRNKTLRQKLTDRFNQGSVVSPRLLVRTASELISQINSIANAADSPEVMRDFYENEVGRVVDIFSATRSPLVTSEQLSELRQAMVTWVFRLATQESEGSMALVLGGSAVNGVHTFLTDLDFIVIPHSIEDVKAARNVQNMMTGLLISIGIDADGYLPNSFGYRTLEELGKRYFDLRPGAGEADGFGSQMSVPFYRFLMDARVIDASQRSDGLAPEMSIYAAKLEALKELLAFEVPEHIIHICTESMLKIVSSPPLKGKQEIKQNPLHFFQLALYVTRVRLGIKESNYWRVLDELRNRDIITKEERNTTFQALCQFVELRHLLAFGLSETKNSVVLTDEIIEAVSQHMEMSGQELSEKIERCRADLISISWKIFSAGRNA